MKSTKTHTKGFTLVEIMIVVVIIGMLVALAVPTYQKIRQAAQDKAVLNNARQLAAAADQYFLEKGVSSAALSDLVGTESTKYLRALQTVAGEAYPDNYTQNIPLTIDAIAGTRTITYAP